jgi:hypothetical protein
VCNATGNHQVFLVSKHHLFILLVVDSYAKGTLKDTGILFAIVLVAGDVGARLKEIASQCSLFAPNNLAVNLGSYHFCWVGCPPHNFHALTLAQDVGHLKPLDRRNVLVLLGITRWPLPVRLHTRLAWIVICTSEYIGSMIENGNPIVAILSKPNSMAFSS